METKHEPVDILRTADWEKKEQVARTQARNALKRMAVNEATLEVIKLNRQLIVAKAAKLLEKYKVELNKEDLAGMESFAVGEPPQPEEA